MPLARYLVLHASHCMADPSTSLAAIDHAAALLTEGKLVAFPTETVYGLGADAENPAAVAAIYAAKGRPSDHPVIVHLAVGANVRRWVQDLPAVAEKLMAAFWPGPLTLIFRRAPTISPAVSGGQDSIALRCPAHPLAQALLKAFKQGQGGIAGPSANRFGHVSPTTAQHVIDEFGAGADSPVACVLDGGACVVGIESTILDLSRLDTHGIVMLRPGQISAAQIAAVTGLLPALPDAAAPRASGTLEAHYAPHTPVALLETTDLAAAAQRLAHHGKRFCVLHYSSQGLRLFDEAIAMHAAPAQADGYAQALYASLRALDLSGSDVILVEQPPQEPAWLGVNDRLRRAAFDSAGVLERLCMG